MSDNPFASDENPYDAPQITVEAPATGKADPDFSRTATLLRQTRPWVRFISVIVFICSALMVLGGFAVAVFSATAGGPEQVGAVLGMFYVLLAILYIAPGVYLWTYASRIDVFLRQQTTARLNSALESQKSFWRFVGILFLIVLCVYLLLFVFAMLAGVAAFG